MLNTFDNDDALRQHKTKQKATLKKQLGGFENVYKEASQGSSFMIFSPPKMKAPEPKPTRHSIHGPPLQSGGKQLESMKYYVEQNPKAKENILICAKFQNALYLEFGHVSVKSTNFLTFQLKNPNTTKAVQISTDRAVLKHGLSISFGSKDENEVTIEAGESTTGTVYWTPAADMSIREIVKLKMDMKAPLQLTIHGVAGTGKSDGEGVLGELGKGSFSKSGNYNSLGSLPQQGRRHSMSFAVRSDNIKKSMTPPRDGSRRPRARNSVASIAPTMSPVLENSQPGPLKLEDQGLQCPHESANKTVIQIGSSTSRSRSLSRGRTISNKSTSRPRSADTIGRATSRAKKGARQSLALDEQWAEKQTASFTDWLNFTFSQAQLMPTEAPANDRFHHSSLADLSAASIDDQDAINTSIDTTAQDPLVGTGTSCAIGLKELWQRRIDAKVRQAGMTLFNSEEIQFPLRAINNEVNEGRLEIRSDNRDLHADLGLQEQLFELLFNYELTWLRLGLEIVCGEVMNVSCSTSSHKTEKVSRRSTIATTAGVDIKLRQAIKVYVNENLLRDKNIQAQFSKKQLLYVSQERKMKELLRRHVLRKFLALVLFLDRARSKQLLPKAMLFTRNALNKNSCDIVTSFCRIFLRGEGDILRHLSLLNYYVTFTQSYTDEFNYEVKNLAVDLRDGVRLVRLFDLLRSRVSTADSSEEFQMLSKQLRVPAVSRLQKLFNVGLLINALYSQTEIKPEAKHIVDGSRDMTLLLLWKMLFSFELRMMITPAKVQKEIEAICQNYHWRRSFYSSEDMKKMAVKPCSERSLAMVSEHFELNKFGDYKDEKCNDVDATECLHNSLLLWCKAIVEGYEVPVYNLTSCLADGRALCLLIHYYHPTILPLKSLRKTTAHLMETTVNGEALEVTSDRFMELPPSVSQAQLQKALHNERRNFLTLKKACNAIGGIPMILNEFDSRNIPEEKTMLVFLGYLFARLVESSEQVRAAIRIQRWFLHFRKVVNKVIDLVSIVPATEDFIEHNQSTQVQSTICFDKPVEIVLSVDQAARILQKWWRREFNTNSVTWIDYESEDIVPVDNDLLVDQSILTTGRRSSIGCYEVDFTADSDSDLELQKVASDENDELTEIKAKAVAAVEADPVVVVVTADGQIQREKDYEVEYKLQHERHRLACTELLLKQKAKKTFEVGVQQVTITAQQQLEEAKIAAQKEQEQLEMKLKCMKEEEEMLRKNTELQLQQLRRELEARSSVEQRIVLLQNAFDQDRETMVAAVSEKQKLFEEWEAYRLKQEEEQERRKAEEEERQIKEDEKRQRAEEIAAIERAARQAAEAAIIQERRAREQAEAKLKAIEDARLAAEADKARREIELKVKTRQQRQAAIFIQSFWRMVRAKALRKRVVYAIITLQSCFRTRIAIWTYRSALLSVMILQACWRRTRCAKQVQQMNIAAIKIQRNYRKYQLIKNDELQYCGAVAIQRWYRTINQCKKFNIIRTNIITLQAMIRRNICIKSFLSIKNGMIRFQAQSRGVSCREKVSQMKIAMIRLNVICIKLYRQYQFKCKMRVISQEQTLLHAFQMKSSARRIQRFIKNKVILSVKKRAASCISSWYKEKIFLLRIRKMIRGFRRLQAVRRALEVRKKCSSKTTQIRLRIKAYEEQARADPTLRLGRRTVDALNILQHAKMISQQLTACKTLDCSTRYSKYCCEAFAEFGAARILFALLRSCNRSTPHQELLRVALGVLLNVGRHAHLAAVLALAPDSTDALVDLMQMFRDKKNIFILAAELLNRLVNANIATKKICNTPVFRKRLDGVWHIMERKHRLEQRVKAVEEQHLNRRSSRRRSNKQQGPSNTPKDMKRKRLSGNQFNAIEAAAVASAPIAGDDFDMYGGINDVEPIHCMEHLMKLLQNE